MEKILAYGFIRLVHQQLESIIEYLKDLPQIKNFSIVTGEYDGVLEIEVEKMDELYELFKKIDILEGI